MIGWRGGRIGGLLLLLCRRVLSLEGRGELESVVEFVDGRDEGSESLACFFGGVLRFFEVKRLLM